MELDGKPRPWVSFPGLFAGGSLDPGTALLLDALPTIRSGSRVLDFGCGTGVIAAAVMGRSPEAVVDLLDADALAVEAAARNVPEAAGFLVGWSLAGASGPYDWIVSNPPFHEGKGETMRVLEDLAAAAPAHLTARGRLILVTQRRLPVGRLLEEQFRRVEVRAETSVFRVWAAGGCHPARPGGSSPP
jgi:16S rRNA (guanine1207-N2)-methyltransferase